MVETRDVLVRGFAQVLDEEVLTTFDRLVPTRPWREALPSAFWYRDDVVEHLDDRRRLEMYDTLVEVVGRETADAALEFLPPVPWWVLEAHGVGDLLG